MLTLYLSYAILLVVLIGIFYLRSGSQTRTKTKLLSSLILATLAILFLVLNELVISNTGESSYILIALSRLCFGFNFFLLYLFFEGGLNIRPQILRFSFITFILGSSSVLILVSGVSPENYIGAVRFIGDTLRTLVGFSVFIFGSYYLYKVQKVTKEKSALVQTIASVLIAFGFAIQFFATPYLAGSESNLLVIQDIADIIAFLGITVLVVFYSFRPYYAERIPVQTFEIMVYSKYGINFHSVKVSTRGLQLDERSEDEAQLMSGLSVAITAFIKNITGANRDLEVIQASDRVVLFDLGQIHISLVAEGLTEVIVDSLNQLRMKYEQIVMENAGISKMPDDNIKPLPNSEFSILIQSIFPYLEIESTSPMQD